MKFSQSITSLLLPLATFATPVPQPAPINSSIKGQTPYSPTATRDAEAEAMGLAPRALVTCRIVHVATEVDCRWNPWHAGWNGKGVSKVRTGFANNTPHDFSCYSVGECINGNCTWDWAVNWKCYVPGYYTDSRCTVAALGRCGWTNGGNPPAGTWP